MVEATEKQNTEIGTLMVQAALDALGMYSEDYDQDKISTLVFAALIATDDVRRNELIKYELDWLDIQSSQALATAFWMWSQEVQLNAAEVSAFSAIGLQYLGFAQGMAAAQAVNDAVELLIDGSQYAFTASGARKLNNALKKGCAL